MNGYITSVVGTVLLCALLTAIAPEGKTSATIKGIARLACVLTIVAPVLQFFQSGALRDLLGEKGKFFSESVIEKDAAFIQYYSEMRINETERALERELKSKYSVDTEVEFEWRTEKENFLQIYAVQNLLIECIHLKTPNEVPKEVVEEMQLYVKENYCSEVLIE